MPLNKLKKYNTHLDIAALSEDKRKISLMNIFDRDITNNPNFKFKNKQITPTPLDGIIKMGTLYTHLTTEMINPNTRERVFDIHRSCRLHWVKHHIDECV